MISYLKGKIKNKGNNYLIINIGNVGYKVFVNTDIYAGVRIGDEIELYIYYQASDQGAMLFGLKDMEELELFEMLLSVSGVGPKTALNVLAAAPADELKLSISSGESDILGKVSGIGKKTANRIVLELKEKIGILPNGLKGENGRQNLGSDEIDALVALGYSGIQAREALRQVDRDITDSGQRIKEALKILGGS